MTRLINRLPGHALQHAKVLHSDGSLHRRLWGCKCGSPIGYGSRSWARDIYRFHLIAAIVKKETNHGSE